MIEAKNAQRRLDDGDWEQLKEYVEAVPAMKRGVAVLTDGREWWLYRIEGRLPRAPTETVKIEEYNPDAAAEALWHLLARKR